MKVLSIKDFAKSNNFKQIATHVRVNANGYPFLTFIDSKNVATNVYFSKAASAKVAEGEAVNKEFLAPYQIAITNNAAGEERVKLISNSERLELEDLLG